MLLEDHPASATPYTPIDVIAKRKSKPILTFDDDENGLAEQRDARRAERNQRDGRERQRQRQKRREHVDELIRSRRRDVLLEKELHAVGQRLQQSVRAHVVRAPARLDVRDDLALEPGEVRQRRHHNEQQDGDLD